jgi:hypothetical protein
MSRFIPQSDMTTDELIACSYQAQALISLCAFAGDNLPGDERARALGSHIHQSLTVAMELVGIMHDALEVHEGLQDRVEGQAAVDAGQHMTGGQRNG